MGGGKKAYLRLSPPLKKMYITYSKLYTTELEATLLKRKRGNWGGGEEKTREVNSVSIYYKMRIYKDIT